LGQVVSFVGWFVLSICGLILLAGILTSLDRHGSFFSMLLSLWVAFGGAISGLFLVLVGQITQAFVDGVNHTGEILAIMKFQMQDNNNSKNTHNVSKHSPEPIKHTHVNEFSEPNINSSDSNLESNYTVNNNNLEEFLRTLGYSLTQTQGKWSIRYSDGIRAYHAYSEDDLKKIIQTIANTHKVNIPWS